MRFVPIDQPDLAQLKPLYGAPELNAPAPQAPPTPASAQTPPAPEEIAAQQVVAPSAQQPPVPASAQTPQPPARPMSHIPAMPLKSYDEYLAAGLKERGLTAALTPVEEAKAVAPIAPKITNISTDDGTMGFSEGLSRSQEKYGIKNEKMEDSWKRLAPDIFAGNSVSLATAQKYASIDAGVANITALPDKEVAGVLGRLRSQDEVIPQTWKTYVDGIIAKSPETQSWSPEKKKLFLRASFQDKVAAEYGDELNTRGPGIVAGGAVDAVENIPYIAAFVLSGGIGAGVGMGAKALGFALPKIAQFAANAAPFIGAQTYINLETVTAPILRTDENGNRVFDRRGDDGAMAVAKAFGGASATYLAEGSLLPSALLTEHVLMPMVKKVGLRAAEKIGAKTLSAPAIEKIASWSKAFQRTATGSLATEANRLAAWHGIPGQIAEELDESFFDALLNLSNQYGPKGVDENGRPVGHWDTTTAALQWAESLPRMAVSFALMGAGMGTVHLPSAALDMNRVNKQLKQQGYSDSEIKKMLPNEQLDKMEQGHDLFYAQLAADYGMSADETAAMMKPRGNESRNDTLQRRNAMLLDRGFTFHLESATPEELKNAGGHGVDKAPLLPTRTVKGEKTTVTAAGTRTETGTQETIPIAEMTPEQKAKAFAALFDYRFTGVASAMAGKDMSKATAAEKLDVLNGKAGKTQANAVMDTFKKNRGVLKNAPIDPKTGKPIVFNDGRSSAFTPGQNTTSMKADPSGFVPAGAKPKVAGLSAATTAPPPAQATSKPAKPAPPLKTQEEIDKAIADFDSNNSKTSTYSGVAGKATGLAATQAPAEAPVTETPAETPAPATTPFEPTLEEAEALLESNPPKPIVTTENPATEGAVNKNGLEKTIKPEHSRIMQNIAKGELSAKKLGRSIKGFKDRFESIPEVKKLHKELDDAFEAKYGKQPATAQSEQKGGLTNATPATNTSKAVVTEEPVKELPAVENRQDSSEEKSEPVTGVAGAEANRSPVVNWKLDELKQRVSGWEKFVKTSPKDEAAKVSLAKAQKDLEAHPDYVAPKTKAKETTTPTTKKPEAKKASVKKKPAKGGVGKASGAVAAETPEEVAANVDAILNDLDSKRLGIAGATKKVGKSALSAIDAITKLVGPKGGIPGGFPLGLNTEEWGNFKRSMNELYESLLDLAKESGNAVREALLGAKKTIREALLNAGKESEEIDKAINQWASETFGNRTDGVMFKSKRKPKFAKMADAKLSETIDNLRAFVTPGNPNYSPKHADRTNATIKELEDEVAARSEFNQENVNVLKAELRDKLFGLRKKNALEASVSRSRLGALSLNRMDDDISGMGRIQLVAYQQYRALWQEWSTMDRKAMTPTWFKKMTRRMAEIDKQFEGDSAEYKEYVAAQKELSKERIAENLASVDDVKRASGKIETLKGEISEIKKVLLEAEKNNAEKSTILYWRKLLREAEKRRNDALAEYRHAKEVSDKELNLIDSRIRQYEALRLKAEHSDLAGLIEAQNKALIELQKVRQQATTYQEEKIYDLHDIAAEEFDDAEKFRKLEDEEKSLPENVALKDSYTRYLLAKNFDERALDENWDMIALDGDALSSLYEEVINERNARIERMMKIKAAKEQYAKSLDVKSDEEKQEDLKALLKAKSSNWPQTRVRAIFKKGEKESQKEFLERMVNLERVYRERIAELESEQMNGKNLTPEEFRDREIENLRDEMFKTSDVQEIKYFSSEINRLKGEAEKEEIKKYSDRFFGEDKATEQELYRIINRLESQRRMLGLESKRVPVASSISEGSKQAQNKKGQSIVASFLEYFRQIGFASTEKNDDSVPSSTAEVLSTLDYLHGTRPAKGLRGVSLIARKPSNITPTEYEGGARVNFIKKIASAFLGKGYSIFVIDRALRGSRKGKKGAFHGWFDAYRGVAVFAISDEANPSSLTQSVKSILEVSSQMNESGAKGFFSEAEIDYLNTLFAEEDSAFFAAPSGKAKDKMMLWLKSSLSSEQRAAVAKQVMSEVISKNPNGGISTAENIADVALSLREFTSNDPGPYNGPTAPNRPGKPETYESASPSKAQYRSADQTTASSNPKADAATLNRIGRKLFGVDWFRLKAKVFSEEGAEVLGKYSNAWAEISSSMGDALETLYHEAFHRAEDLFLTKSEFAALKRAMPDAEARAEGFVHYVNGHKGVTGKVRTIFERLWRMMKAAFNNKSDIDTLYETYDRLHSGKFVDSKKETLVKHHRKGMEQYWAVAHGTGSREIREFSDEYMSTGAGDQWFGYGGYFAENSKVAKGYIHKRSVFDHLSYDVFKREGGDSEFDALFDENTGFISNEEIDKFFRTTIIGRMNEKERELADSLLKEEWFDRSERKSEIMLALVQSEVEDLHEEVDNAHYILEHISGESLRLAENLRYSKGQLYTVDIIPNRDMFMSWYLPYSQQSEHVQEALIKDPTLLDFIAKSYKSKVDLASRWKMLLDVDLSTPEGKTESIKAREKIRSFAPGADTFGLKKIYAIDIDGESFIVGLNDADHGYGDSGWTVRFDGSDGLFSPLVRTAKGDRFRTFETEEDAKNFIEEIIRGGPTGKQIYEFLDRRFGGLGRLYRKESEGFRYKKGKEVSLYLLGLDIHGNLQHDGISRANGDKNGTNNVIVFDQKNDTRIIKAHYRSAETVAEHAVAGMWGKIWNAVSSHEKGEKVDIKSWEYVMKTMTFLKDKIPALREMWDAVQTEGTQHKHSNRNKTFGEDTGDMIDFKSKFPELYEIFKQYLLRRDRDQAGYKVSRNDDGKYDLKSPLGEVVKTFKDSHDAEVAAKEYEHDDYVNGVDYILDQEGDDRSAWKIERTQGSKRSEKVAKAIVAFRNVSDRRYDHLRQEIKNDLINFGYDIVVRENADDPTGSDVFTVRYHGEDVKERVSMDDAWDFIEKDSKQRGIVTHEFLDDDKNRMTIFDFLRQMGDRRGYYFPRDHGNGSLLLWGTNAKGIRELYTFNTSSMRIAKFLWMEKNGYTDIQKDRSDRPSAEAYLASNLAGTQEIINKGIDRMVKKGDVSWGHFGIEVLDRERKYKEIKNGQETGVEKNHWLIRVPSSRWNEILKGFHGHTPDPSKPDEWSIPYWSYKDGDSGFEKDGDQREKDILAALASEYRPDAEIGEALASSVAAVIRERGSRASMLARKKDVQGTEYRGRDVYGGFDEDPVSATIASVSKLVGGTAKTHMLNRMMNAMQGRRVSFREWMLEPEQKALASKPRPQQWNQYIKVMKENAIDSARQPQAWKIATSYMKEMTRNETNSERAFTVFKSLVAWKFLSGPMAGIMNLTTMPLVVPATLLKYGNIPLARSPFLIAKAAKEYTRYRLAVKRNEPLTGFDEETLKLYAEIRDRGWDAPLMNDEIMAAIEGQAKGVYRKATDFALLPFSESERFNRVVTIVAAYRGLREQKQNSGWKFSKGAEKMEGSAFNQLMSKAKDISDYTHATYDKSNIPIWMHGGGGAAQLMRSMYMYRTYPHNLLQLMASTCKGSFAGENKAKNFQAFAWLMVAPAVLAGKDAFPFHVPLAWLVGKIFSMLGLEPPDDPEEALVQWMADNFGDIGEEFARGGILGSTLGISLSGSMALGANALPATIDQFMYNPAEAEKNVYQWVGGAVMGIPGSVVFDQMIPGLHKGYKALDALSAGNVDAAKGIGSEAIMDLAPRVIASPFKGVREATDGVRTRAGAPVFWGNERLQASTYQAALRWMGATPSGIANKRAQQFSEIKIKERYTQERTGLLQQVDDFLRFGYGDYANILADIALYNERIVANQYQGAQPITENAIRARIKKEKEAPTYEKKRENPKNIKLPKLPSESEIRRYIK